MDRKHSYWLKAAQCRLRVQTESDPVLRAALQDLANDYLRLAERPGHETALTVQIEVASKGRGGPASKD